MAEIIYQAAIMRIQQAGVNLVQSNIAAALVMTNTTCDSEDAGIETLSDFSNLDRFDGIENGNPYSDKWLTGKTLEMLPLLARSVFDAADPVWTALQPGTRSIKGVLVYLAINNDNDSVPLIYFPYAAPQTPDGDDFPVEWDLDGILQVEQA